MKQIVDCCDLVMFVSVKTTGCIISFEPELFKVTEQSRLNRDFILANYQSFVLADGFRDLVPGVSLDLLCCVTLVWVDLHDLSE